MKIFKFLIAIIFLAICFQSCDQKPKKVNKNKKIISLKFKKKMFKKFEKGTKIQGFSVDKDGVLRPDKNYEIVRLRETKQFLVKPIEIEYKMADNVDVEEMPDGSTMVCHCGLGAGDNCAISETQFEGGDPYFGCNGTCSCGAFYFDVEEIVAQFQTIDGN